MISLEKLSGVKKSIISSIVNRLIALLYISSLYMAIIR